MPRPSASLSLDLDNKWSYLKTHGDPQWREYPSYLDQVVPRFLEMFQELGLRITVFVVGQDAALPGHSPVLRSISEAGHEIGNHSFHHAPWLHRYSDERIEEELSAAEEAIQHATGAQTRGFRGPGYSFSAAVLASLTRRGYLYDASTLPTFIGPLARAYYFFSSRLSRRERRERNLLFGSWRDACQPIRPYWWQSDARMNRHAGESSSLLEIPVTTMPILRLPMHVSYLLYLYGISPRLAWQYWRLALGLCRLRGMEPSLLLHPLDILGGDEESDLSFFPAMNLTGTVKRRFVRRVLTDFMDRYQVLTMAEHAGRIAKRDGLSHRAVLARRNTVFTPTLEFTSPTA